MAASYVRLDGAPQTYLVRGALDLPSGRSDWFDARITDIKSADLSKIVLTDSTGATADFVKTGDKLLPTLADGKTADEGKANRVTCLPAGLRLFGCPKGNTGLDLRHHRAALRDHHGLAVTATAVPAATDSDKGWIRIKAEAVDPKAADAAKAINDKAAGYEFKVNTIHTEMFGWKVADLAKAAERTPSTDRAAGGVSSPAVSFEVRASRPDVEDGAEALRVLSASSMPPPWASTRRGRW